MLRPSYSELMDILNENADMDSNEVTSRYTIVVAAAKRARQLIDGDEPMVASPDGKPVSTAVNEIAENKIKIVPKGEGTILKIYMEKDENKNEDENEKKAEMMEELQKIKIENEENDSEEEYIDIEEDLDEYEEDDLDEFAEEDLDGYEEENLDEYAEDDE